MVMNRPSNKDLRAHWDELHERIRASQGLCILSGFDGALVPVESRADKPRLPVRGRRLLERLQKTPRVVLGVVSGRALPDLIGRVGVEGLWYVGNHGFEIQDPRGREHRFYEPSGVSYLAEVQGELMKELKGIQGALLENKGPTLAVHYRKVARADVTRVEGAFLRVMDRHRARLTTVRGHGVYEARVRSGPGNGLAVRHIRYLLPLGTLTIYFGDNLSDRDAFLELQPAGLSVEVGGGESSIADYTLPDSEAVLACLADLHRDIARGQQPSGKRRSKDGNVSGRRGGSS